MVNDYTDFNTLKELLGVTDGNLASCKALESSIIESIGENQIQYYATELGKRIICT